MGIDYKAHTIIGIITTVGKIKEAIIVNKIAHIEMQDEDELDDLLFDPNRLSKVLGINIIYGTFTQPDPDNTCAYIGQITLSVDEYDDNLHELHKLDDWNLDDCKQQLKQSLSPLGLWDEDKFGLWCVLYCSY